MSKIIVSVKNLVKTYDSGKVKTYAVRGIGFDVGDGEFVALSGPSGSGKSTTLYQIGLLDSPTGGKTIINGRDVSNLNDKQKSDFRLNKIGYVFQHYELLPELTSLENVYLPLRAKFNDEDFMAKANKILDELGLGDRKNHYPNELSGGEQQRVSIARALVKTPDIILADEPTANLDSVAGEKIMELLKLLNRKYKTTIIVVNHEPAFDKYFDRIIRIKDGKVVKIDKRRKR